MKDERLYIFKKIAKEIGNNFILKCKKIIEENKDE